MLLHIPQKNKIPGSKILIKELKDMLLGKLQDIKKGNWKQCKLKERYTVHGLKKINFIKMSILSKTIYIQCNYNQNINVIFHITFISTEYDTFTKTGQWAE